MVKLLLLLYADFLFILTVSSSSSLDDIDEELADSNEYEYGDMLHVLFELESSQWIVDDVLL